MFTNCVEKIQEEQIFHTARFSLFSFLIAKQLSIFYHLSYFEKFGKNWTIGMFELGSEINLN
jgi:hypothetical protein